MRHVFCHFVAGVDGDDGSTIAVSSSKDATVHLLRAGCPKPSPLRLPAHAQLRSPFDMASDGAHLYIADNGARRVLKVSLDGSGRLAARSDEHRDASALGGRPLGDPFGVAVAPAEPPHAPHALCFVSDRAANRVCALDAASLRPLYAFCGARPACSSADGDASAAPTALAAGAPRAATERFGLSDPCGLAFAAGCLYVCDRDNGRLVVFDRTGVPLRTVGCAATLRCGGPGTFLGPCGVAVAWGHLFVIDSMGARGKVLQVLSAAHGAPRRWLALPHAVRLVGVGSSRDALYVCDMRSGAEAPLYRCAWGAAAPSTPRAAAAPGRV